MNAPKSFKKHLTVRNVPPQMAEALEKERRGRGLSLNETVIRLLQRALGLEPNAKRSNGLAHLAGDWSEEEFKHFEKAIEPMEQIDEEMWR